MPLKPATTRVPTFHALPVVQVEPLTDDAAAVTLAVPAELTEAFAFTAGQHLTVRRLVDGVEQRRSYSICLSPQQAAGSATLRIGVGRVAGGAFSPWLIDELAPGDRLEAMEPTGTFGTPAGLEPGGHHVAICAGSGITPVLSIIASLLERDESATATVLFGNRRTSSIMFLEELEDLKNRFVGRLQLVHVLSREARDADLLSGRLDAERLRTMLGSVLPADVAAWYLCGPFGLVETAREVLADAGVPRERVHFEIFHVDDGPRPAVEAAVEADVPPLATVTLTLDGRTTVLQMTDPAETILDATLRVRPDAPYSCTGGVCGTCRARVVEGEVEMVRNYALEPDEVADGWVLACQAHPRSDAVRLDYA